jgi:hypothetical protein
MTEESSRLTRDDFIESRVARDFTCPYCGVESSCINRDAKRRKYIASLECVNPHCSPSFIKKWHKCRLCLYKAGHVGLRIKAHVDTLRHKNSVAAFESTKSLAYLQAESDFVEGDEVPFSVEDDEPPSSTTAGLNDGQRANDEEAYNTLEFDGAESTDFLDYDHMLNLVAPETVPEWKRRLFEQSISPRGLFSDYFPTTEEKTPQVGYKRNPMNGGYYDRNHRMRDGPRFLVAASVHQNSTDATVDQVRHRSALWSVLLSSFANRLTNQEQQILTALLFYAQHHRLEHDPLFFPLAVPNSTAQLRQNYTDGRRSIQNILPRPTIQILADGFVYISIREIVQYHLANGKRVDPLIDLRYYSSGASDHALHGSSERGKTIVSLTLPSDTYEWSSNAFTAFPMEVLIWSDGFDPSGTKNNRGSAHVIFMSFGTPQDDYHSGCNTYLVSLGPSNGNLSLVQEKLVEELISLSSKSSENLFFDASAKKELSIFLRVFCTLQDRPERCSWLKIAYGNGKFAGRFGWAGDLSHESVFEHLPSCEHCHTRRMNNLPVPANSCVGCADWDMSKLYYRVPGDYPTVFREDVLMEGNGCPDFVPADLRISGSHLACRKVCIQDLKDACTVAFEMVKSGRWTKRNGYAFLETFALSPEFVDQVCTSAASNAGDNMEESFANSPLVPVTWNIPGLDISHHIDALMHLCFLGITKANSTDLINSWLKGHRKANAFKEKCTPILKAIAKLSLYWCNVETQFGGYVSENWIAYCRLYKYIHQFLTLLSPSDEVYSDPLHIPFSRYNLKQKKAWLRARDIRGINGKSRKGEVEEVFAGITVLPKNEIPAIVEPVYSNATLEEVNQVVVSWHSCVSRIMSIATNPGEKTVEDLDRHIKIFLTCVNVFDRSRRAQATTRIQKLPVWRRKSNYLGLLNYPDTVKEMGPLRALSELDFKGEASIQLVKRHINHGTSGKNWSYNAALGYYKEKSFKVVINDAVLGVKAIDENTLDGSTRLLMEVAEDVAGKANSKGGETSVANDPDHKARYKNHVWYTTSDEVEDLLKKGKVVSGIVAGPGKYCVAIGRYPNEQYLEVRPESFLVHVCGADYFVWGLKTFEDGLSHEVDKALVRKSTHYLLLLPLLNFEAGVQNNNAAVVNNKPFYLITSEWRELLSNTEGPDAIPALGVGNIPGMKEPI